MEWFLIKTLIKKNLNSLIDINMYVNRKKYYIL